MITCHRTHLEERCRERGYTLADVMACVVAQEGDTITVDVDHPAYPRHRRRGLGDIVADGLAAIGITKARVSSALGVKDCGCVKRQEQLNQLGRRFGIGITKPAGEVSGPAAAE